MMPATISRKNLLPISSLMASSESMMGIPALMKTASCREKCMRSLRGTFFLVSSNCRTDFFLAFAGAMTAGPPAPISWSVTDMSVVLNPSRCGG